MEQETLRDSLKRLRDARMAEEGKDPFTRQRKQYLDKFQVITARLIDTLHGHLAGNHTATSIDNTRAVCELIAGLAQHLKKRELIPSSLYFVYQFKLDPDSKPDKYDNASLSIRKDARASSNFAKHADRDAGQTRSFGLDCGIDMLVFNMTQDYETLECALINQGLLNREGEELYPIKRSLLLDFYKYRNIFHPYYASGEEELSDETLNGMFLKMMVETRLREEQEECCVPAGTAACIIARTYRNTFPTLSPEQAAQKIRELGIWPVNTKTNASIKRDYVTHPENNCDTYK